MVPPLAAMQVYLIDWLKAQPVGMANQRSLEALCTKPRGLVAGPIQAERMYHKTYIRLLMVLHVFPERLLTIKSLQQLEVMHEAGKPPPGYMETQLSRTSLERGK